MQPPALFAVSWPESDLHSSVLTFSSLSRSKSLSGLTIGKIVVLVLHLPVPPLSLIISQLQVGQVKSN